MTTRLTVVNFNLIGGEYKSGGEIRGGEFKSGGEFNGGENHVGGEAKLGGE